MQWQASLTNHPTYNELILDGHEFGANLYMVLIRPGVLPMHDSWFANVEDAKAAAREEFGVAENAWQPRAATPGAAFQEAVPPMADVRVPAADPAPPSLAAAGPELIAEVRALLADGHIIAAVALYRRRMRVGLYEAKRAVDAIRT